MDDLKLFSTQCWQFVDLMRIPVNALRVVQFTHQECQLGTKAANLLRISQQPIQRFLQIPWRGFTIRHAKDNRQRFSVYHRFVEDAFQCPQPFDLTLLLDTLDVWSEQIEWESYEDAFFQHSSAAEMLKLTEPLEDPMTESEVWARLSELQATFRRLADMVPVVEPPQVVSVRQTENTPATHHSS